MFKKVISIILVVALLMPLFAQQSDYVQGQLEGERDGKGAATPAWVLAGLGCGCIGFGAAYLSKGEVPAAALNGRSAEYVMAYSDAYTKAKVKEQAKYAGIGWAISVVVNLVLLNSSATSGT